MNKDLPGMLAVAKGIAEQRWPHTMDAKVWADEFMKMNPPITHGLMLGWFANAIMAGYDTAQQRAAPSEMRLTNPPGSYPGCDTCACPPGVCQSRQAETAPSAVGARLVDALRAAVAAKDAELEGFRRNLGRNPLVKVEWLDEARAVLREAEGAAPSATREHVAWCRYVEGPTTTTIVLCDSDTPGAFKVYRAEGAAK